MKITAEEFRWANMSDIVKFIGGGLHQEVLTLAHMDDQQELPEVVTTNFGDYELKLNEDNHWYYQFTKL